MDWVALRKRTFELYFVVVCGSYYARMSRLSLPNDGEAGRLGGLRLALPDIFDVATSLVATAACVAIFMVFAPKKPAKILWLSVWVLIVWAPTLLSWVPLTVERRNLR